MQDQALILLTHVATPPWVTSVAAWAYRARTRARTSCSSSGLVMDVTPSCRRGTRLVAC